MANRKKSRNDRMTPGFNPPREKRGKYVSRKDAFGEEQHYYSSSLPKAQQGTLFSHRALMNMPENQALKAQQVGPRGFSKARLDEVRGALGTEHNPNRGVPLHIAQRKAEPWEIEAGYSHQHGYQGGEPAHWMPEVTAQHHIYGPEHGIKNKPGRNIYDEWRKKGTHEMLGTLARSGMPAEHLRGLSEVRLEPHHEEYAGTYHQARPHESPSMRTGARIKLYGSHYDPSTHEGRSDQEVTLMHELGHHWSHEHSGDYGGYSTPHQRGIEEARADTYAMRHWRQDPRNKPEYGVHFDPRSHTYGARGQDRQFEGSYQLAPQDKPPEYKEHGTVGHMASQQARNQPMLDMHLDTPVFTQRPKETRYETEQIPLQSGETRRGWVKQTQEAKHFAQVPHQEAIYRHEAFRGQQRTNRRDEAKLRREISQRWSVGRQFRGA